MKTAWQAGGSEHPRGGRALLTLALLQGIFSGGLDCQTSPQHGRAETVYLQKILKFVKWPPRQEALAEVFRAGVAGKYGTSFDLAKELRADTVGGQKIDVQPVQKGQSLLNCQVSFEE